MSHEKFDAIKELANALEAADINVTLFGMPVSGPNARALRTAIEARIAAAVSEEREACAKAADLQEERWRAWEVKSVLATDRWQHRQQANVARDVASLIRNRGGR